MLRGVRRQCLPWSVALTSLRSVPHFSNEFCYFFNGVALGVPRFGSALGLPCALVYTLFQCFFDILLELGRLATLLSLLACAGVGQSPLSLPKEAPRSPQELLRSPEEVLRSH